MTVRFGFAFAQRSLELCFYLRGTRKTKAQRIQRSVAEHIGVQIQ